MHVLGQCMHDAVAVSELLDRTIGVIADAGGEVGAAADHLRGLAQRRKRSENVAIQMINYSVPFSA